MSVTRVVIVDDEPDMVENCARILGRVGYQCFTTTEPLRALALLEEKRPDLLITDLKMPGILRSVMRRSGRSLSMRARACAGSVVVKH